MRSNGHDPCKRCAGAQPRILYLPKKVFSSGPREPSGNRLRGRRGTCNPNRWCHVAHASVVNTPVGASSNTFRNSSIETYRKTTPTSAGLPYTIKCPKNVFRSANVSAGCVVPDHLARDPDQFIRVGPRDSAHRLNPSGARPRRHPNAGA
jgi:hypothetical protein